jgi:hypothetical protein
MTSSSLQELNGRIDLPSDILENIFSFVQTLTISFYEQPVQSLDLKDCFGKQTEYNTLVRLYPHVTIIFKDSTKKSEKFVDAKQVDYLWKYSVYARVICNYKHQQQLRDLFSEQCFDHLTALSVKIIGYDAAEKSNMADELCTLLQRYPLNQSLYHLTCEEVNNAQTIQKLLKSFPGLKSMNLGLKFTGDFLFSDIDGFYDHPSLKTVILTGLRSIETVNSALEHDGITKLEYSCEGACIDDRTLHLISNHPNLKILKIVGDQVDAGIMTAVAACSTMKYLTVYTSDYFNKLSLAAMHPSISRCQLRSLATNCRLSDWQTLADLTTLTALSISLYRDQQAIMSGLVNNGKYLKQLSVSGSQRDAKLVDFAKLSGLRELYFTRLLGINILKEIDDLLIAAPHLERLYISERSFTPKYNERFKLTYGDRICVLKKSAVSEDIVPLMY